MRVFVTGATGFIGTAIVEELIRAGHQVLGLARSEAAARALLAARVEVHRGALDDLDSLKRGAAAADGVIHAAFVFDYAGPDFVASGRTDRQAIDALGAAGRPLVVTSLTAHLTWGHAGSEDDAPDPKCDVTQRAASEQTTLSLASRGVRAALVRLPTTVHGDGDHGLLPALIGIARATGVSAYVGDGATRWPSVHRLDAAELYRLALEHGAAGSRFHAIADEGVRMYDVAHVIGRQLGVPVVAKSPEDGAAHFGWLAQLLQIDCPASSALTQARLAWRPNRPGLIADLDRGSYFAPP